MDFLPRRYQQLPVAMVSNVEMHKLSSILPFSNHKLSYFALVSTIQGKHTAAYDEFVLVIEIGNRNNVA